MFGLESQKNKKNTQTFDFELEKEMKDFSKQKEILGRIESRIQKIKEYLRSGDNKEDFDSLGLLLHGYNSLMKVLTRCKKGK